MERDRKRLVELGPGRTLANKDVVLQGLAFDRTIEIGSNELPAPLHLLGRRCAFMRAQDHIVQVLEWSVRRPNVLTVGADVIVPNIERHTADVVVL